MASFSGGNVMQYYAQPSNNSMSAYAQHPQNSQHAQHAQHSQHSQHAQNAMMNNSSNVETQATNNMNPDSNNENMGNGSLNNGTMNNVSTNTNATNTNATNSNSQNADHTQQQMVTQQIDENTIRPEMYPIYGTCYEVKCEETFAYYQAYLIDFDEDTQEAIVGYENDWKQQEKVKLSAMRPAFDNSRPWTALTTEPIECMAKSEEFEPYGWWKAWIRYTREDIYYINFDGWDETHNEYLPRQMLRPYNDAVLTIKDEIKKDEFHITEVSDGMPVTSWIKSGPPELKKIRKDTGLLHLGFHSPTENVLLIGTENSIERAKILLGYFLPLQKKFIGDETYFSKEKEKIQSDIDKFRQCVKVEFTFDPFLTRFVIGREGSTFRAVQDRPGIHHIEVSDGKCSIHAESQQAALEAKDLLNMEIRKYKVPRNCLRDIIGKNGENVRDMERNWEVCVISTWTRLRDRFAEELQYDPDAEDTEESVTMVIIGPTEHVGHVIESLNSIINHVQEKRALNQRAWDAHNTLTEITGEPRQRSQRRINNAMNSNRDGRATAAGDNRVDDVYNEPREQRSRRRMDNNSRDGRDARDARDARDDDYSNGNGANKRSRYKRVVRDDNRADDGMNEE